MGERPILAVDVDGVVSLFGFDQPPRQDTVKFELIDGMMHCISLAAGDRLRRLSRQFELVWATGWEERANDLLPDILGLPHLDTLTFDGAARWGAADWKIEPLTEKAAGRALAWIDDSFDERCYEWARRRQREEGPTLLVPTESHLGLEEAHVEALSGWAAGLARRGKAPNP